MNIRFGRFEVDSDCSAALQVRHPNNRAQTQQEIKLRREKAVFMDALPRGDESANDLFEQSISINYRKPQKKQNHNCRRERVLLNIVIP
jgi:hypothetical protein